MKFDVVVAGVGGQGVVSLAALAAEWDNPVVTKLKKNGGDKKTWESGS